MARKCSQPRIEYSQRLTKEQRRELFELRPGKRKFTDLLWLLPVTREPNTLGYGLITGTGITEDAIKARIEEIQTGNPEWYLVPPNLVDEIRSAEPTLLGRGHRQIEAIRKASQYQARLRWAPKVVFEHVLLALLVDGTDTSNLLGALTIDRAELSRQLDALLPHFETGPYFPEHEESFISLSFGEGDRSISDLHVLDYMFDPRSMYRGEKQGLALLQVRGLMHEHVIDKLHQLGFKTYAEKVNFPPKNESE